jgi:hypothetical protein
MVDGMDAVAELGDVLDGALDEDVLVADEYDPDDPRWLRYRSSQVQSSSGRTTPFHCPW